MSDLAAWTLLSMRIALIACVLSAAIAVPAAFFCARRRAWWITVIETFFSVPIVLPPTVLGYLLVLILGRHGVVGAMAVQVLGHSLLLTEAAAVIAATIVALPLVYLPAKSAFAAIDHELADTARLWGAGPWTMFWQISLPMARRGIVSGLVLAFARALGEFGATVMVFGIQDRRTLPIAIWLDHIDGNPWPAVTILGVISFATVVLHNRLNRA